MNLNAKFLKKLQEAFNAYLEHGARSNEKLKPIHSFIADSLKDVINNPEYEYFSLSENKKGGEKTVSGYYMDKTVDIAVCRDNKVLGALGFKFVMSNYKQNANNYFENMLGETANIRCANIPYFQILVLLQQFPYYDKKGKITGWEDVDSPNLTKYITLSSDNIERYMHTPVKTLLYVLSLPKNKSLQNKENYSKFYKDVNFGLNNTYNSHFSSGIIVNDFDLFIRKVSHYIQSV